MYGTYKDSSVERARLVVGKIVEAEAEECLLTDLKNDCSFENFCTDATVGDTLSCQVHPQNGNPVHEAPTLLGYGGGSYACSLIPACRESVSGFESMASRPRADAAAINENATSSQAEPCITILNQNNVSEAGCFGGQVNMVDGKDLPSHTFKQDLYKWRKILDSEKSSSIPPKDTQMRGHLSKRSQNAYSKMEEYIALTLNDITKGNMFEFFKPKVAEIEGKMKSGYYRSNGLGSLIDDIYRMCRDAFKAKIRDNAGDMQQNIMHLIDLAQSLKENPKLSREREGMIKKLQKVKSDKKGIDRSQITPDAIGGTDYGTHSFDRGSKKSLSKIKKRNRRSESEPSDDSIDDILSEEDDKGEAETTSSYQVSDLKLHLRGRKGDIKDNKYSMDVGAIDSMEDDPEWGVSMTKASVAPPVTRTYELIEKYLIIADEKEVQRKMSVSLPDDFAEELVQKSGMEESDMQLPRLKEYKPSKLVGEDVLEQEVYGIDSYTHDLLLDSMPDGPDWPLVEKHKFIEEVVPCMLNKQVRQNFTQAGHSPSVHPLCLVVEEIKRNAGRDGDIHISKMCQTILKTMQARPKDTYVAYGKGLGVVCTNKKGFGKDVFVVELFGEVYPVWKWFEKQDGIKYLQKNTRESVPELYNMYLERPMGDPYGYDLVMVDAMHKGSFASRISHSCRPNCEAKVIAVEGQYQIGIFTVRPISYGEELTIDYNCVTDSKKEYEDSVCLCGSQICRGGYLDLVGEDGFQEALADCHGILDRHKLMLEACESIFVSQEDQIELKMAGLGTCLLAGLPDWLVAYTAHLVRVMNLERARLPYEILKHNLGENRKISLDTLEVDKSELQKSVEYGIREHGTQHRPV